MVLPEEPDVHFRVFVAHGFIGIEAQHLVGPDGPGDLLVHIGFDELGTPVAMVTPDEADTIASARLPELAEPAWARRATVINKPRVYFPVPLRQDTGRDARLSLSHHR